MSAPVFCLRNKTRANRRLWFLCLFVLSVGRLSAQLPMMQQADTLLRGATIFTADGDIIENGEILVSGQRIKAIGHGLAEKAAARNPDAPKPRVIDCTGKVIIPALIDAASGLGASGARGMPSYRVIDRIDLFTREPFTEALEQGVAFAYSGFGVRGGIFGGQGALLTTSSTPREPAEQAQVAESGALHVVLGSVNGPLARAMEVNRFSQDLKAAKKYEEDWEKYREELKKYEEALKEKAKKGGKAESRPATSPTPAPAAAPPQVGPERMGGRPPRRRGGGHDDHEGHDHDNHEEHSSDEHLDEPKPIPVPIAQADMPLENPTAYGRKCPVCGDTSHNPADHLKLGFDFNEFNLIAEEETPKPEEGAPAAGAATKPQGKPQEPAIDPNKEVIVQAIHGKIPLRIRVDWAEDILGALSIVAEYPAMRVIWEGVSEGHLVASELAKAGFPAVVLAEPVVGASGVTTSEDSVFDEDFVLPQQFRREFGGGAQSAMSPDMRSDNAFVLAKAGVPVALGSIDKSWEATPRILDRAAYLVSLGLDADQALSSVTRIAADASGAGQRLGFLAAGRSASFVILSGRPFLPGSTVEQVYVEGRRVYNK